MRSIHSILLSALVCALCFSSGAMAQISAGTIDPGTTVTVRTTLDIDTNKSDGRVFTAYVEQDVRDRNGNLAIPKGSAAELVVRNVSNNEVALDLDSITVAGQRYGIETREITKSTNKEGLGANKRTGKYVGGGAALGAIIGAIAGGGKGAAIGAGAGAAAGAGVQVLTRGSSVKVPAESLLTFALEQPLRAGIADNGYTLNGNHYHRFATNQQAYNNNQRQKPGAYSTAGGSISVGNDHFVTWQGPAGASVWVQADNGTPKLFGRAASATEPARWMNAGHIYVFMLRDASGYEIARDVLDLR